MGLQILRVSSRLTLTGSKDGIFSFLTVEGEDKERRGTFLFNILVRRSKVALVEFMCERRTLLNLGRYVKQTYKILVTRPFANEDSVNRKEVRVILRFHQIERIPE